MKRRTLGKSAKNRFQYQEKHKVTEKGLMVTTFKEKLRHYQYKTLFLIKNGHYTSSISRQMKVPRTTVEDRIKRLLAIGLIKIDVKSSAVFYRLTKKGYEAMKFYGDDFSRHPRQKAKTRLHRLCVKFQILKDNEEAEFDNEYELNNWIQKYTRIRFPLGITIKKTSKSIIAMFHEFETDNSRCLEDFFNHIMRGTYYVYYYCMNKLGITIDIFGMEVIDQHIVNEAPELSGKISESKTTTLDLQRKAKAHFKANFGAKAWLDHSKGLPEIETNDFLYEENLLAMPERIESMEKRLVPVLNELSRQIALHLEATREWKDSARDIRDSLKEMMGYFRNSTGNKGDRDEK